MSDIDPNKIAAEIAVELTKNFFMSLKDSVSTPIVRTLRSVWWSFEEYLSATYTRCSYVRTIISKDRSFNIDEIYVPGRFSIGDESVSDEELMQRIRDGVPSVVVGFGGIGKTVFTKKLWCSIFAEPKGKIPVFLELRRLNNITDLSLRTYIRILLSATRDDLTEDIFKRFLKEGMFIFIFDGFDELADAKKEKVTHEILELTELYTNNGFVVSSRMHDTFYSWQRYNVYRAQQFSKVQTERLIEKVPYDRNTKKKFKAAILSNKYEQYQSFLSTPLLTMMMLMTFSQFAEVPDRRSVFYRYAFLTLYSWHDSSKETFNREKQSGLSLDEFEKLFSIFCLLTYAAQKYELDSREFLNYIQKTRSYTDSKFDADSVIREICESVNLMYKDGDLHVFTHRSFQEYFTAYALVNFFQSKLISIVDHINHYADTVLPIMAELNIDVIDEYYISKIPSSVGEEIEHVAYERSYKKIATKLNLNFVAGVSLKKNEGADLRIFGINNDAASWKFVQIISSFFVDEHRREELQPLHSLFNANHREFEAVALQHADVIEEGCEGLIIAYDIAADLFRISPVRNVLDDFDEGLSRALSSGEIRPNKSEIIRADAKNDVTMVKANYVFSLRKFKETRRRMTGKEVGIEDIIADLQL